MTATATTVRFLLNNTEHEGTLISKRGLFWEIETEPGITKKIPVKAILNRDADLPANGETRMGPAAAAPAKPGTLAAQLETLEKAQTERSASKRKEKKEKEEKDPNVVELATLCKEYGILGRIARRRLRKVLGKLPQGTRWEWNKDSDQLQKVRDILAAKEDPADPADAQEADPTEAADQDQAEAEADPAADQDLADAE